MWKAILRMSEAGMWKAILGWFSVCLWFTGTLVLQKYIHDPDLWKIGLVCAGTFCLAMFGLRAFDWNDWHWRILLTALPWIFLLAPVILYPAIPLVRVQILYSIAGVIIGLLVVQQHWKLCMMVGILLLLIVPILSPQPYNDVWYTTQEAGVVLRAGENIYGHAYQQIYPPELQQFFGGHASAYYYFPLPAILAALSNWLVDYRWIALLIFFIFPLFLYRKNKYVALLVVLLPSTAQVVEQGWSEVITLGILGLGLWLMDREHSIWGLIVLSLLATVKQTNVLLCLFFLGYFIKNLKTGLAFLGPACLILSLFAIFDWAGFYRSTIGIDFAPRSDSFGLYAVLVFQQNWNIPLMDRQMLIIASCISFYLGIWGRTRALGLAYGCFGVGMVYFIFFLLARVAFLNYYFFAFAILWAGIALLHEHH